MNTPRVVNVAITEILVSDRLREPDAQAVKALRADIAERGLRQPIEIAEAAGAERPWRLISGGHRLAACDMLGWNNIPAFVVSGTSDDLLRDELLENLARSELTMLERARFTHQLRDLWFRSHPDARHGGDRRSSGHQDGNFPSWSAAVAQRTGWSADTIKKSAKIGRRLDDAEFYHLLRGTPMEHNQRELERLSRVGDDLRLATARILRERGGDSVRDALSVVSGATPATPRDEDEVAITRFETLWTGASDRVRAVIRDRIDREDA